MDEVQHDIEEYKAVVNALAPMINEAADPALSPDERMEKIRLMKPLFARHDELLANIKAAAGI